MTASKDLAAAIAVTRFGLGGRPGEIDLALNDPKGFLRSQITTWGADQPDRNAKTSIELRALYKQRHRERSAAKIKGGKHSDMGRMDTLDLKRDENAGLLARVQLAAGTESAFRERWALFWANHFTVSAEKKTVTPLAEPFDAEAIRPRIFGRFEDMLVASSRHPAMLLYLDQNVSLGPNSLTAIARRGGSKATGLNENLAREILELHTVGLGAGYTQADVTEFARAMSGWQVGGQGDGFRFNDDSHEPGARTIMGKRYPAGGDDQARAVLKDLAASPHTARHLSEKIARHFVADDPPGSLISTLEAAYSGSGGSLGAMATALIDCSDAWDPAPRKFKTPYEFIISSCRASGVVPQDATPIVAALTTMGQIPFAPPSPKGWSDEEETWCAPDALIERMTWSEQFSAQTIAQNDPSSLAISALGARLSPLVSRTIASAETRPEGLSILLMSPEFLRR